MVVVLPLTVAPPPSPAAAGAAARHARGAQRRRPGGRAGAAGAALAALLPAVSAAGLRARAGVHVGRQRLLPVQPLLGPRVHRRRLCLRHLLRPGFHGDAAPPVVADDVQGEFDARRVTVGGSDVRDGVGGGEVSLTDPFVSGHWSDKSTLRKPRRFYTPRFT